MIDFRIWDKINNKFLQDVAVHKEGYLQFDTFDSYGNPIWKDIDDSNLIFSRYTGIRDKNNKKIFEGDIIQQNSKNYPEEVKWEKEYVGFTPWVISNEGWDTINKEETMIIGNIYQNSNLLEIK